MRIIPVFAAVLNKISTRLAGKFAFWLLTHPRRFPRPAAEEALAQTGVKLDLPQRASALAWGNGPTILLVHGWEGRGTQLGAFVQPLVARGFRVVAVDGPAHRGTPGRQSTVVHYARFLRTIGDALGELHAVIAHSAGGPATLLAMRDGMRVGRIVAIAAPNSLAQATERFARALGLSAAATEYLNAELKRFTGVPVASIDIERFAGFLKLPGLLLHAPDDMEIPLSSSEIIRDAWRDARLVEIPGAGHRRILKSEIAIAEATRFVAQSPAMRREDSAGRLAS